MGQEQTMGSWPSQAHLPADRLVDLARWRSWYRSPVGAAHVRRWAVDRPALLGWEPPPAGAGTAATGNASLEAPTASHRTDAMQAALVSLTGAGDQAAAVTLLVQLRPGLARLVRWLQVGGSIGRREAVDEVRSVFFEVLAGHCLERRPTSIAANLILDSRQRLTRDRRPLHVVRAPLDVTADIGVPHVGVVDIGVADVDGLTSIHLVDTMRAAADTLPGSPSSRRLTVDLGYRAWVLGQSRSGIAQELAIGAPGVRSRLHRFRSAIRAQYNELDGGTHAA